MGKSIRLGLLAGALLLALAGCGDKPAQQLEKARQLAVNDRRAALVLVKSVIQAHPSLGDARLLLGTLLLEGGEAAAAEIELRRALELGAPDTVVVPTLARALLAIGQPGKVVAQFGNVAWADAGATARLKTLLAEAQAMQGDLGAAQASLAAALRALPDHEPALRMMSRVVAVGGDLPAALKGVDALLAGHPDSAEGWVLKGDLMLRSHAEPAEVIAAYRKALSLRPDNANAHAALIALHLAQRDRAAAQAQFEVMQKLLPRHPQTLLYEGQFALLKGDLPRARELFQGLLRAAPDNLMLLQSAGMVELRLHAPAQAEVLLAKALQLAPESTPARRLLAQSYLSLGQPAKALATLEPLIGANQPDAEALALAARARLLAGQADMAAALFERAAKLKPDDPKIRTAVALSKLSRGKGDAALAELQAVAESDDGNTADLALIATQMRRKAYGEALKAVAALERKQPDRPLAAHLRGQVLQAQGDLAGARQAFELALQRDGRYFPSVVSLAGMDFRDGKADAAKARFEALLVLDPKNGAARQALAELAARSGADREAVSALLEAAVKASPADVSRRLALIDHHLATYNAKAALVATQAALVQWPDQFELLARLGQALLASGDQQQALVTYNRMVSLQGKSPAGYLGLAETQLVAGDAAAAARTLRRLLELAPDQLAAQRLAITVALRQKQPAQALAIARDVQRQRPDRAVGYQLEGEIELAQKHGEAALPPLRKALGKADAAQVPERLHQALLLAGKAAEADALERSWLKDHPRDTLFLFYLGDSAMAKKDYALAEQRYQAVLAVAPEHALSLNNVAWLLMEQKKPGALAYAERAVRAAPDRPPLMDTLSQAYAADNQAAKAIELQKRALAMQPEDPFLRLNLARYYAQAGEKRLAKTELDRLAALGERFPRQEEVAALTKGLGGLQR